MSKLSLYWPLDRDGYRIEKAPPAGSSRAAKTIIASINSGPSIVRNGGRLDFDRDVMQIHGLYRQLALCDANEKGALSFVSKFGFLRETRSELVEYICHEIKVVRTLVAAKKAGNDAALDRWMTENKKVVRLHPEFKDRKLFWIPSCLRDAIYLQFFQDLSTGTDLRLCKRPGCDEWFTFGPGTMHRNTAEYCSPKCQKAHAYTKSKGAKR